MSIRGSNFENQHPFASDHALVWERCIPDGLLYGVDMSFTSTLFTLGTGFMLVAGRMFEITAAENISISPGSGYARVYVAIDTGGTATENSFDQVSFGVDYAANLDSFTELTQGEININQGAAVYQAEVAVLTINSSGVTGIERQMELVSPGAGTGAFAAIAVTYPAGSTVTVTDGKITYTAPNTNGAALFIIPYAATWTVTATDGTETTTQTVEITTEGQSVNITLSFVIWLIKDGVLQVPFVVTNRKASAGVDAVATFKNNEYEASTGTYSLYIENNSSGWSSNSIETEEAIAISGDKNLYIDGWYIKGGANQTADSYAYCYQGNPPTYNNDSPGKVDIALEIETTVNIPLSAFDTIKAGINIAEFNGVIATRIRNMWIR